MSNLDDIAIKKKIKELERSLPRGKSINTGFRKNKITRITAGKYGKGAVKIAIGITIFFLISPPFFWPVHAAISSGFLFRFKPDAVVPNLEIHRGLDLAATRGTPIKVSSIGIVSDLGNNAELGKYVRVSHLLGLSTLYAHLSEIYVKPGDAVARGQIIGRMGSTGRSSGTHLHFEVRRSGVTVDPRPFLK